MEPLRTLAVLNCFVVGRANREDVLHLLFRHDLDLLIDDFDAEDETVRFSQNRSLSEMRLEQGKKS